MHALSSSTSARACRRAPAAAASTPSRRPRVLARAAADGERDALARSRMPGWEVISQYLNQRGLRTVPPTEAKRLQEGGEWLVVDVRPPGSHAKAAPKGVASVPLYVPLEVTKKEGGGFDFSKGLKALAYALNGVSGVEPNLQFEQQLAGALKRSGAKGALFLCEAGGTLRATPNFPAGKSSRSLQACFRALRDGLLPEDRILHVTGGAAGWFRELGPEAFDGAYDASEAGRTPNAAAEPTGQFVEAAKEKMGMK